MKLALGYLLAFLTATVAFSAMMFTVLVAFVGILSFATWSIPTNVTLASTMFALRLCISLGAVVGIMFMFSKECNEAAKDFANGK